MLPDIQGDVEAKRRIERIVSEYDVLSRQYQAIKDKIDNIIRK